MTNDPAIHQPEIIYFNPVLAGDFRDINLEWLKEFFHVTPQDLDILNHPERIIQNGGQILFVQTGDIIAGTAALKKINGKEVELIKMGVLASERGKGIGSCLMEAIISEAQRMKANKIILETAKSLNSAIALYHKYGFIQTTGEEVHPLFGRITFRMEKLL